MKKLSKKERFRYELPPTRMIILDILLRNEEDGRHFPMRLRDLNSAYRHARPHQAYGCFTKFQFMAIILGAMVKEGLIARNPRDRHLYYTWSVTERGIWRYCAAFSPLKELV